MKFSLVILLGFCALMAQGSHHSKHDLVLTDRYNTGALNSVTDVVQKIVQALTDAVNKIVEKAKEVNDKIAGAIGEVVDKILGKVNSIVKAIADLAKAGAVAKKCSDPYQEQIQEIMTAMQAEVEVCRRNGMEQVQEVQQEMQDAVNEMIKLSQDVYHIVAKCLEGEGAFGCLAGKIFTIRDKVKAGYEKATKTISTAQERLPAIIESTQTCVQTAQEKPTEELNNIVRIIQKCIAENTFYYL